MKDMGFAVDDKQIEAMIAEVQLSSLSKETKAVVVALLVSHRLIVNQLQAQDLKIEQMKKRMFGSKTEKSKKSRTPESHGESENKKGESEKPGHGRASKDEYPGAERVIVGHELKAGDQCPECAHGKLYQLTASEVLRFFGQALIKARIFTLPRLRCSGCLNVSTAKLPVEAGPERHHPTANAAVALLNYGSGVPFYRMEGLQKSFGCPLSDSTQFEMSEKVADKALPVYRELEKTGAGGAKFFHDDTSVRIQSLMKENESLDPKKDRTGQHTTGVVAELYKDQSGLSHKVALFTSGRNHAGENLGNLLSQRPSGLELPMQIADAASLNFSEDFKAIVVKCMDHGRRKFTDIESMFAEECGFIIEKLGQVYHFDRLAKDLGLSDHERLQYHAKNSGPIINELNDWMETQLEERKIEPNSPLGESITYFLKHWNGLTQFLRVPGAPLSNAEVERLLKRCVLRRKASLFYRTLHGAAIGDILMSVIETARFTDINIFEYLTDLQLFAKHVKADPQQWLPWNYAVTRAALT